MERHAALMLAEARAGQLAYGSIRGFLRNPDASLNVVKMYVAVKLSIELETPLVCVAADGHDAARALLGVHLTDGKSVIVTINLQAHITYDECAPFLLSDIGFAFANGAAALVSPWRQIILVRNARSTLCPKLGLIMGTYAIDKLINTADLEVCLSMLVGAHPIAALLDQSDESDESDEDALAQARAQDTGAGAAAALDPLDLVGLDRDEIVFQNDVTLIEMHVAQHGGLPTQNRPPYCPLGRRVQYFRTLYSYQCMQPEHVARLERVHGWSWDVNGDKFRARIAVFIEYTEYIAQHPDDPLPPRYARVPSWIWSNRRRHRLGQLKQESIDALTATPGWSFPLISSRAS